MCDNLQESFFLINFLERGMKIVHLVPVNFDIFRQHMMLFLYVIPNQIFLERDVRLSLWFCKKCIV